MNATLERIQRLMDQRGWSAYHLSKVSGVPQSTLSNMFIRNNDPTISTLENVCKGFGITILQFFSGEGDGVALTEEQLDLLGSWSKLSTEQKQALTLIMHDLLNGNTKKGETK